MRSILSLVRQDILSLIPYESARSLSLKGEVFLDANENPSDLETGTQWNRYPSPQPKPLMERLSKLYGVPEESLLATRGSDEAIDLLVRAFCQSGKDEILICPPTYGMYEVSARIQGVKVSEVPLIQTETGFALDETGIHNTVLENDRLKIIFLCVPNNPTGTGFAPEALIRIAQMTQGRCILVIDEAYNEYSSYPTMSDWISKFPNLVILRTLSKAWASAGVRCGTAIAQLELIGVLQKIRAPYPIATPCLEAILRATTNQQKLKMADQVQKVLYERDALSKELRRLTSVIRVFPSDANFLLVRFDNAQAVFDYLKERGIILRNRSKDFGLKNCIRITVGSSRENLLLIENMKEFERLQKNEKTSAPSKLRVS